MNTSTSRRRFIRQTFAGTAAISLSGSIPELLLGAAQPGNSRQRDKILVVLQLSGGNDGLNTVVPYGDDSYYKNRFTLALGKNSLHRIDDHIGLHPSLGGFQSLLEKDQLSIVQGVGYPDPNRSHFESMDLWHTAHRPESIGWLGHLVDHAMGDRGLPAIHFGTGLQPLALKTDKKPIPSIQSLDQFKLKLRQNEAMKKQLADLVGHAPPVKNELLGYVYESANVALETSHQLEAIGKRRRSEFEYPGTQLGRNLGIIAQLIGSGLSTQVFYTSLDGFDTHSNQADAHSSLLRDLGDSVQAFMSEIEAQGNADRVCLFSFSEFGRRVRENASRGTDHGTAAPVFVVGNGVRPGLLGESPDFTDLDNGDLKFKIDYRQVYSDLLKNWLEVDPDQIVGGKFSAAGIFKPQPS